MVALYSLFIVGNLIILFSNSKFYLHSKLVNSAAASTAAMFKPNLGMAQAKGREA